jgi:hypothetical protein
MAKAAKGSSFWAAVVAEARTGAESHATIAAKHGVSEAALQYHLYAKPKREKQRRSVEVLPVRVGDEAHLISVELGGSLRLRFAEGCDPGYVAALVAKLR